MKKFRCGDVVPGCGAAWIGTDEQILEGVGEHARRDHGMTEITPELVLAVRSAMQPA